MQLVTRRVARPLDGWIDHVWHLARPALPHAREWGLPSAAGDIVVPLSADALHRYASIDDRVGRRYAGGVLQGARERPFLRDTSRASAVVGVHLRPGGLAAFVDGPADAYTDCTIALADLWGGFAGELRDLQDSTGTRRYAATITKGAASMSIPAIHEVFPYLRVRGAADAIGFYRRVFGATEKFRLVEPSGRIGHCELQLGPTVLMLSEEYPEYGLSAPDVSLGNGALIHLHVDDCDALAARMVEAGAALTMPPADQFYGERSCRVRDPYGHDWLLGHSIEDVSVAEMQRRYTALFA